MLAVRDAAPGLKVSVIIPNYNYAAYLPAAVDSALGQTHRNIEVLVVDDGSTDGSAPIIRGYGDRITPIFKANGGQASTWNSAFPRASGDIILFLDADDMLEADAVATIVAAWRPGLAKVQYPLSTMDGEGRMDGNLFPRYPADLDDRHHRASLLATSFYPCSPCSGNAWSRAAIERLFPLPQRDDPAVAAMLTVGSDDCLNIMAPVLGDVVTISRPLGRYRVHGANIYAMGELDPKRFARMIDDQQKRVAYFNHAAAPLGVTIDPKVVRRFPGHMELRLAHRKIASPEARLDPSLLGVWRDGLNAVLRYDGLTKRQRLMTSAWMTLTALAPRRLAADLVRMRFIPTSRPRFFKSWLSWSQGRTHAA